MILETKPGRFRYTVIFAATRRGLERFESLDAMPAVLRARCLKALESRESGTVLISGETAERVEPPQPAREQPGTGAARRAEGRSRLRSLSRMGLELLAVAAAAAFCWLAWRG